MIRRFFICVSFVFFVFSPCFADERIAEITPQDALEIAWKQNSAILSARSRYEASIYDLKSAKSLSNPQFTFAPTVLGEDGSDSVLEFSQKLEINGIRNARKYAALGKANEEKAMLLSVINDVSLKTESSYWDFVKAGYDLDYNAENVAYFEALKTKIARQVTLGFLPVFHLSRIDIELSKAKQELFLSEFEYERSLSELRKFLGFDENVKIRPICEVSLFSDIDKEDILALALQKHPDILLQKAKIQSAEGEERIAKTSRLPDLELIARKSSFEAKGGIALALTFPIFDWGGISNQIKASQKRKQNEKDMLVYAVKNIQSDLRISFLEFETSMKIVREYEDGLMEKAEKISILAEKAYEKGAAGFLDLTDSRRNFAQVRIQRIEALINCHKSLAKLRHSCAQFLIMEENGSNGGKL